jgi:hypothetical protein
MMIRIARLCALPILAQWLLKTSLGRTLIIPNTFTTTAQDAAGFWKLAF